MDTSIEKAINLTTKKYYNDTVQKRNLLKSNKSIKNIHQYKYESPFILAASKRAEERAKAAKKNFPSSKNRKVNDWDLNTKPEDLFDPTIKKEEIFKPKPGIHVYHKGKIVRKEDISKKRLFSRSAPINSSNQPKGDFSHKMTIKTNKDKPVNNPGIKVFDKIDRNIKEDIHHPDFRLKPNNNDMKLSNFLTIADQHQKDSENQSPNISMIHNTNKSYNESNNEDERVQSRSTSPFDENIIKYLHDDNSIDYYSNPLSIDKSDINRYSSPFKHRPLENPRLDIYKPSTDMMSGMAKLIDAVGNMVSNVSEVVSINKLNNKHKKSYKSIKSNPPMINQSTSPIVIDMLKDLNIPTPKSTAKDEIEYNTPIPLRYNDKVIYKIEKPIIKKDPVKTDNNSTRKLSKSSVLDMVLSKLQEMEKFEKEVQETVNNIQQSTDQTLKSNDDISKALFVDNDTTIDPKTDYPSDIPINEKITTSLIIPKYFENNIDIIRLPSLPSLNQDTIIALKSHQLEMLRIKKFRDIPFKSNKLDYISLLERISDKISDEVLHDIFQEIDSFIDDYADHFVNKL